MLCLSQRRASEQIVGLLSSATRLTYQKKTRTELSESSCSWDSLSRRVAFGGRTMFGEISLLLLVNRHWHKLHSSLLLQGEIIQNPIRWCMQPFNWCWPCWDVFTFPSSRITTVSWFPIKRFIDTNLQDIQWWYHEAISPSKGRNRRDHRGHDRTIHSMSEEIHSEHAASVLLFSSWAQPVGSWNLRGRLLVWCCFNQIFA